MYDIVGKRNHEYPSLYNDIANKSNILQDLIDSSEEFHLTGEYTIVLDKPINIDISKLSVFDGGNSTFIVSGDFPAFIISGSMVSGTADPISQTEQIVKKESGFIFEKCKIIGNEGTQNEATRGCGIELSGCVNITIDKCYIANLKDGIVIKNRNRDINIVNNNLYGIYNCGIRVESSVNLHQMNIVGNMIQYCHKCIFVDDVKQYANYQITGNDIEISTWADRDMYESRCILINISNDKRGYFGELIMSGNTIQGHSHSDCLIELNGGNVAKYTSITGNHISNCKYACIKISKCDDTSIVGNTFKNDTYKDENAFVIKLDGCNNTVVSANTFSKMGRLINLDGTATPNKGIAIIGNVGKCEYEPVTQSGTNTGVCIANNIINEEIYPS